MNPILKTITAAIVLLTLNLKLGTLNCSANNLTLGGTITVVSGDQISFTVAWDNSWKATSPNWDAVWLFVKYKDCSTTNWLHAPLTTTSNDHTVTGGVLQVDAVSDGMGVFVRRIADGSGNIAAATVTLKLSGVATGTYNFKVFGIEMVNVPQNNNQVGDLTSTGYFNGTGTTISSEGALTAAQLGTNAPLPVALSDNSTGTGFPKGYNAFYSMKYEISQEEYVDFLNTLTYDQQANRVPVAPSIMATNWAMGVDVATVGRSRNGVKIMTSGVPSTTPAVFACDFNNNGTAGGANYNDASDGQNIACNYLSWADLTAYLDWAALRPMTELEFEKNCRGVAGIVAGEYVWGTLGITQASPNGCTPGRTNDGANNEATSFSGNGLSAYAFNGGCSGTCGSTNGASIGGPFRVGFAATATTTRITAGATYYGAMDMGGNLGEPTVQTNATGAAFTGVLGDGTLDAATGNANAANWPAAAGTILRGGGWNSATTYLRTSDRAGAAAAATRTCTQGGRGVR